MANFFVSMQPGTTIQVPVRLLTGTVGEARVQRDIPPTEVEVDGEFILAKVVDGPNIEISALAEGIAEITIRSGGVTSIRVTVEEERGGLRWVPGEGAQLIPFDPNGYAEGGGLTFQVAGLPSNAGTLTVGGAAAAEARVSLLVAAKIDGAGFNGTDAVTAIIEEGDTQIAAAVKIATAIAQLEFTLATSTDNVVNFNLQGAGTIEIMLLQATTGASGGGTPDPFPPGSVDGPNSSPHGDDYWLQRDMDDKWFIWWNVDTDPGPDVKKKLPVFLADENVDQAYRDDVLARAEALGYGS